MSMTTPTFADAFASDATRKGPPCESGRLVASLPDDQRADLAAALASGKTTAAIVRALERLGHKVPSTFGRHRNGICQCPKTV